jgi:uncharacterized protein YdeI (YjbR/CyaY-like superfamily)
MPPPRTAKSIRFTSARDLRGWLEKRHECSAEAMAQLRKIGTVEAGITYAEALDLALCFGWIDGVRPPLDDAWYLTWLTPRINRSTWSLVNLRHFDRLDKLGLIAPAGRAAFDRRDPARIGVYSFEKRPKRFPPKYERAFRAKPAVWGFFEKQPPGYRRLGIHWVIGAKREETRQRRLAKLVADSAAGRRVA